MTDEDPQVRLQSLLEEWKRTEHKLRYLNAFSRILVAVFLIGVAYLAFMFPAASIPSLAAAGIARFTTRTMSEARSRGRVLGWAIAGGAGGYTMFAALGVGVPASDAPLVWRVVGGLVFGAAAGVAAWLVVSYLFIYVKPANYLAEPFPDPIPRTRLRPVVRWTAGIFGVWIGITGIVFLFVGASTVWTEGIGNLHAWKDSALFWVACFPMLDGFCDLATDLVRFGPVFLAGTTAEFAALVTKAERTRPPRGFAALSPGHHPARLGLGAPQDATGAERCAVSVEPVDRMFATPPDSPGQCEPGLSDDRPRDPRFCYCPELSLRATRSSSS